MVVGIRNIGNSCYMASVIQCLRCVRRHLSLTPIGDLHLHLSGEMEDAQEFYIQLMEETLLGSAIERELSIEFQDASRSHFLFLDQNMTHTGPRIVSMGRALCVFTHPIQRFLQDVDHIIVHDRHRLDLVGAIAYIPEGRHYYAIVESDGRFLKCDDSLISDTDDGPHNLYMLFFVYKSNV